MNSNSTNYNFLSPLAISSFTTRPQPILPLKVKTYFFSTQKDLLPCSSPSTLNQLTFSCNALVWYLKPLLLCWLPTDTLVILHWNVGRLHAREVDELHFVDLYSRDIICIQVSKLQCFLTFIISEYIFFKYNHTRFRYCNLAHNDFQIGVGVITFVRQVLFAFQFFIEILFSLDPNSRLWSVITHQLLSQFFTPLFYLCFMLLPFVSHAKILDLTLCSYPLFQPVKTFSFLDNSTVTILSGIIPVSFLLKFAFSFLLSFLGHYFQLLLPPCSFKLAQAKLHTLW